MKGEVSKLYLAQLVQISGPTVFQKPTNTNTNITSRCQHPRYIMFTADSLGDAAQVQPVAHHPRRRSQRPRPHQNRPSVRPPCFATPLRQRHPLLLFVHEAHPLRLNHRRSRSRPYRRQRGQSSARWTFQHARGMDAFEQRTRRRHLRIVQCRPPASS